MTGSRFFSGSGQIRRGYQARIYRAFGRPFVLRLELLGWLFFRAFMIAFASAVPLPFTSESVFVRVEPGSAQLALFT
jgi:hypothetical protein